MVSVVGNRSADAASGSAGAANCVGMALRIGMLLLVFSAPALAQLRTLSPLLPPNGMEAAYDPLHDVYLVITADAQASFVNPNGFRTGSSIALSPAPACCTPRAIFTPDLSDGAGGTG